MSDRGEPSAVRRVSGGDRLVASALALLCVLQMAELHLRLPGAESGAVAALLLFIATGQRYLRTRERLLLLLAALVTATALLLAPEAPARILEALGSAAFLASFMLLLALLREAAATSDAVLEVGHYLTEQPPGRRYLAVAGGGHALGVLLNFGALSLLGPLLQRGARRHAESDAALAEVRERRQITALNRGFAWFITWSPTTITQATVVTVVAGVELARLIPVALTIALVVFLFGWLEDRVRWRGLRALRAAQGRPPVVRSANFPGRALLVLGGVCLLLGGITALLMVGTGVRTVPALMLAAPLVTLLWIALQHRASPWRETRARLGDLALRAVPESSPEAVTLAIGGYLGMLLAGLVPAAGAAAALHLDGLPPELVYALVMAAIPLFAQLALHPILMVTFLGTVLGATPTPGLDPTLLALSLAIGWSLNLTASPFSASSLVLGRVTGIAGTTLSWRWNALFSPGAWLLATLGITLFSRLLSP